MDETREGLVTEPLCQGILVALSLEATPSAEITVLLASDERIHVLNREFRGVDSPTDVLTFPSGDGADGDVAIAVPYARRQAARRGVPESTEFVYLAIHGALHLCGLDDATDEEADEMRRRMSRAAVAIGLPPDEAWGSLLHEDALC